jgi:flagellin
MKTMKDMKGAGVSGKIANDQESLVNQSVSNNLERISQNLADILQPTKGILTFSKLQNPKKTILIPQAYEITKLLAVKLHDIKERANKSAQGSDSTTERQDLQAEINYIKAEIANLLNMAVFRELNTLDKTLNNDDTKKDVVQIDFSKNIFEQLGSHSLSSSGSKQLTYATPTFCNTVEDEQLTINGLQGSAVVSIPKSSPSYAIAELINNQADITGVYAYATTSILITNLSDDGTIRFNLAGNNDCRIMIISRVTKDDLIPLIRTINNCTEKTGIIADTCGANNVIKLQNLNGSNITISNFNHSATSDKDTVSMEVQGCSSYGIPTSDPLKLYTGNDNKGLNSVVINGNLKFFSNTNFTVESNLHASNNPNSILAQLNLTPSSFFSSLMNIDVSTLDGAFEALIVADAVFGQIDNMADQILKIQSRFISATLTVQKITQQTAEAMAIIKYVGLKIESEREQTAIDNDTVPLSQIAKDTGLQRFIERQKLQDEINQTKRSMSNLANNTPFYGLCIIDDELASTQLKVDAMATVNQSQHVELLPEAEQQSNSQEETTMLNPVPASSRLRIG